MMYGRRLIGCGLVVVVGLTIRASAAQAQAAGIPLRMMPSPTGISIGADIGFAQRLPPGATEDQGTTTFGASLALGLGPLTASAGISRLTTFDAAGKSSHDASVGAQAGVKVFGGPLVPLSVAIEGGLARVTKRVDPANPPPAGTDERRWRSHLGLGASLTIPNPVLAVKPWLAPRLQYDGGGGISLKRLRGAISAGVDLGLLNGITIRAMYDSRMLTEDPGDAPRVVSIGLGYSFR